MAPVQPAVSALLVLAGLSGCLAATGGGPTDASQTSQPPAPAPTVNTDAGSLERTRADVRILLAQGVSVDGDPLLAGYAAEACRDLLKSAAAADIVFLVCGLGGATGTGAGPVLAEAAKDAGRPGTFVAGSVGPLQRPKGEEADLSAEEVLAIFREQTVSLAEALPPRCSRCKNPYWNRPKQTPKKRAS